MEISEGVHRLEAPLGDRYVALYLLVGERRSLLIDTGLADSIPLTVMPYLRELGIAPSRVDYVLTTHSDFDHMGGNDAARASLASATFLSHVLDRELVDDVDLLIDRRYGEFIPGHGYDDVDEASKNYIREHSHSTTTDVAIVGGELLKLGPDWEIELVHTPGHSWGSTSVWDPRSRTMFIGDAVLGDGLLTKDGKPAFPPTYRYVDDYRATIRRLSERNIQTLAASHYPLYHGPEVDDFLKLSMAYTQRVEDAIVETLRGASAEGSTAMEIIAARHAELGPWPRATAEALMYAVVGHLELMELERRVQLSPTAGYLRWTLRDG